MIVKRSLLVSTSVLALSLVVNVASASAEQWYFFVKNNSSSTIKRLFVAEPNKSWGEFDIGSGIAPGENTKMIWDSSTNNQQCRQWIKAKFADGSESTPSIIDFCQNLDDPIVFQ
ncbi:hypothetical protein [Pseudanabaena sp. ABRG5-3]|uniref:hypothetical protein n=1 Tax=Pseudanabaena sp. ABRG5-3 TaxID=685565 RepID=UPI000DC70747|nr:hypothetical protein [Pseudanabaena sp. ABRG5-3]BBC26414.1 hypothetical protein ABRG53_4157 [Pseudanabaena sp. ABRG5-3]